MADIVIINPKFEVSFWGFEFALPVFGKKANMAVGALPLLAALTPPEHTVSLVDESVEAIDFDRVAKADVVAVTGMNVQRHRMREVLTELKKRGVFTVVGGAWVSIEEDYFGDLADVIFVGEAEETWPEFLRDWQAGRHRKRYEQAAKTDMTRVPTPRYDLLKTDRYLFGAIQFSRGCPFQCEFCDIIVTFGRRPRLKTAGQIIAELDAMYANGVRDVFVVDDNLIGNKQAIKGVLRELIPWQEAHGYRMAFFTEASLDLAEDAELLDLMVRANMLSVFVGIESPNDASLRETKKYQNVRKGTTILDRVHTIQRAGLEVMCGMIVGFDNDDRTIFDAQRVFIREARIPQAMFGMLQALRKTPLYDRLLREGRLDPADGSEYGTNVIPKQISREELRAGYILVMNDLYDPKAFFDRLDALYLDEKIPYCPARAEYRRRHIGEQIRSGVYDLARAAVLFARLMRSVKDPALRRVYRARVARVITARRDPGLMMYYLIKCCVHYHLYMLVRDLTAKGLGAVNPLTGPTQGHARPVAASPAPARREPELISIGGGR
ncbi:MAG: Fe-S oxidoreductase [Gemmataceae bacterium]|nr:Fe-S oxidoreductase [Gemmataceae bacterium]